MKKYYNLIASAIVVYICVTAIPGTAFASDLDSYLSGTLGTLGICKINTLNRNLASGNNGLTTSKARSYGSITGKLHKYLGYGTMAAAVTAGVSGGDNGFHKGAGDATAALAVATCITGFMEYSNYFDMSEGLSVHNIHIVLGTVAAAGFVATAIHANSNNDTGHAGLGIGSAVLMTVPIIVLHF